MPEQVPRMLFLSNGLCRVLNCRSMFLNFYKGFKGSTERKFSVPRYSNALLYLERFYKTVSLLVYLKDLLGITWYTSFFPTCSYHYTQINPVFVNVKRTSSARNTAGDSKVIRYRSPKYKGIPNNEWTLLWNQCTFYLMPFMVCFLALLLHMRF